MTELGGVDRVSKTKGRMSDSSTTRRNLLKSGIGLAAGAAVSRTVVAQGTSPAFRVAVTGDFESLAAKLAPWDTLGDDVEVVIFTRPFDSPQATIEALRDFDAVTLMHERVALSRGVLEKLPRLKLIVASGSRSEALDEKAAAERNILVYRSRPNFDVPPDEPGGEAPCELTIALLMACTWQTGPATTLVRQGGWSFRPGTPLRGKTLGVLGYGSIGRPVARVALALGMRVLAFARSLTDEAARAEGVIRADLDFLLKSSDVISVHLPLNASTRGMIGARQIAQMKSGVIVINTARAAIIEERPFIDALRTRKIAMAGLDVYWEEPLPEAHPLKQLSNVVMTPHIGYATEETMVIRYRRLLEALIAYRRGTLEELAARYSNELP